MNEDVIRGKWKQLAGKAKARWSRLTDDDLGRIEGDLEQAAGRLQERYGVTKDQAKREWEQFCASEGSEERDERPDARGQDAHGDRPDRTF